MRVRNRWCAGDKLGGSDDPADFFEEFIKTEAAAQSTTLTDLLTWQPPARPRTKRAK
jgi:hypothetical protein